MIPLSENTFGIRYKTRGNNPFDSIFK